jgi:hypothetical protein
MSHDQIRALCQQLQAGCEELARLRREKTDSRPGEPASAENMAKLREAFPALPADYLAFLDMHNGWQKYWFDEILLSSQELIDGDHYDIETILEVEADNGRDLSNVIVIGWTEGDSWLLYIDPIDNAVVDHHWTDENRYPTFTAYLTEILKHQRWEIERVRAALRLLEQGKSPEFRAVTEHEATIRAATQLRGAPPPEPAAAPRLDCVPAYVRRARWTDQPPMWRGDGANVQLALNLYLAYNPTSDEMREALRVWRRRLPWDGKVSAALYNYCPFFSELDDPGDENAWASFLSEQLGRERYGFGWIEHTGDVREEAPGARCFSVRAFSYVHDADGNALPSASLCQATLPMDADPELLIGLAQDLARVLPVRSGLAGFQARWSTAKGMSACYDWQRRFHGLDLQDSDHIYPAVREGVRGANWLTILGRGLTRAYAETKGVPEFNEPQIQVLRDDACTIFRAGERPTLGDVARGEAPMLYATVERCILPLKIGTPNDAQRIRVFTRFEAEDDRYGPWLYRLTDPDCLLTHSAWELSQLLEETAKEGTPEEIDDLVGRLRAGEPGADAGRLSYNAGCYAAQRGFQAQARSLYEHSLSLPNPIASVIANLLPTYIRLGEIDRACEFAEEHLHRARELPLIYFNAACAFGERGDAERALELARRAIEEGYDKPELIKADSSLALLADDPRFQALFADSTHGEL